MSAVNGQRSDRVYPTDLNKDKAKEYVAPEKRMPPPEDLFSKSFTEKHINEKPANDIRGEQDYKDLMSASFNREEMFNHPNAYKNAQAYQQYVKYSNRSFVFFVVIRWHSIYLVVER